MKLKMIVIGVFCLLFSGCSPTADPQNTLTPSPEITPATAPQHTQSSVLETPAAEALEQGKERYFTLSYGVSGSPVKNLLEDRFSYSPTTIDIIISNDDKYIGFIYEYGIDTLTAEDFDAIVERDVFGNRYLYYGELTKISDEEIHSFNIYQSKGSFIPSWKEFERTVSDDIDFYVIQEDEYLSISFSEDSLPSSLNPAECASLNFSSLLR